ncbi:DNA polymerase iota [Lampetra fluviatilis]
MMSHCGQLEVPCDGQEGATSEDETEWRENIANDSRAKSLPRSVATNLGSRVIIHVDMDCFYAQVEMIRNPELRDKPLGIQQKYLLVTCNYVARAMGVCKMMSVKAAQVKCPGLVLVSGEDLTHYREMSYQVTELLERFSPLVERLGFDENYVDVTELVHRRLGRGATCQEPPRVEGHVYDDLSLDASIPHHVQLAMGSVLAAEIRGCLLSGLGLTSCAGIAHNKLAAKLVGSAHKPNQQTVLLPEGMASLLGHLTHPKQLTGIGYRTSQRLEAMGVGSMEELRSCPLEVLEKALGSSTATFVKNLSCGEDNSPVLPSGPPQSLSDEDSFQKASTKEEVVEKMRELLGNLLPRLRKDGRVPGTVRLSLRRFTPGIERYFSRESRQCPIPAHLFLRFHAGDVLEVIEPLLEVVIKLFHKMIDVAKPFHLTLLNICFSKLGAAAIKSVCSKSIGDFFTSGVNSLSQAASTSDVKLRVPVVSLAQKDDEPRVKRTHNRVPKTSGHGRPNKRQKTLRDIFQESSASRAAGAAWTSSSTPTKSSTAANTQVSEPDLPPEIDASVFHALPPNIRREVLADFQRSVSESSTNEAQTAQQLDVTAKRVILPNMAASTAEINFESENLGSDEDFSIAETTFGVAMSTHSVLTVSSTTDQHTGASHEPSDSGARSPSERSRAVELPELRSLPADVDPQVFTQLPAELQEELFASWRGPAISTQPGCQKSGETGAAILGGSLSPQGILKYFKRA